MAGESQEEQKLLSTISLEISKMSLIPAQRQKVLTNHENGRIDYLPPKMPSGGKDKFKHRKALERCCL